MLRLLYNINTALYICISTILRYPRHMCTYPLSLLFIDTRNDAQIHLERKQKIIISQTVSFSFDADVKSHLFPLIKTDIVAFLYNGKNSCTFIPFVLDISCEKANNSGNTISFM